MEKNTTQEERARELLRLHFGSHYENVFIEPEDIQCTVNAMIEFAESENKQLREELSTLLDQAKYIISSFEQNNQSDLYNAVCNAESLIFDIEAKELLTKTEKE